MVFLIFPSVSRRQQKTTIISVQVKIFVSCLVFQTCTPSPELKRVKFLSLCNVTPISQYFKYSMIEVIKRGTVSGVIHILLFSSRF